MTILGIVACVAVNKTGVISLQRKGAFCSWQLIDGVHSELAQKGNSDSRRLSLLLIGITSGACSIRIKR